MSEPPSKRQEYEIFDRDLVRRRRTRAAAGFQAHDFLITRAAQDLIERMVVVKRCFSSVLDLGCHTGQFSGFAAQRPDMDWIVQADLSEAMATRTNGSAVVMDEERLPFADESFDLVVSILSLHWVNDLPGALIQINRALKPDGLFLGVLFGANTLKELRDVLTRAEMECEDGVSPRISPFVEVRDAGGLLQRARLALPVADVDRITVRYDTPLKLMAELRGMGETNSLFERRRKPLKRSTLMRACELYQETYGQEDGRIPATFELVYLSGWAPHESQQKPMRPGSARTRLADALGAREVSTGVPVGPSGKE